MVVHVHVPVLVYGRRGEGVMWRTAQAWRWPDRLATNKRQQILSRIGFDSAARRRCECRCRCGHGNLQLRKSSPRSCCVLLLLPDLFLFFSFSFSLNTQGRVPTSRSQARCQRRAECRRRVLRMDARLETRGSRSRSRSRRVSWLTGQMARMTMSVQPDQPTTKVSQVGGWPRSDRKMVSAH